MDTRKDNDATFGFPLQKDERNKRASDKLTKTSE